jgi:uroporphyrin-III C-methyltransferase
MNRPGHVYLVGAGPGDPELLTVKAMRILSQADVVVYDRLVSVEILKLVPKLTRLIPVGKAPNCHPIPQSEINRILVREARQGYTVARLKGGDPFIFGRGSEEAIELMAEGLNVEVVPGISAAQGCSAVSGVPLTHRGLASGVRFVTGHCREDLPLDLDWDGLADSDTTLVVYMGGSNIAQIALQLTSAGLSPQTPILAVNNGTTPREKRLVSDLSNIARDSGNTGFSGPVLFIIGRVVTLLSGAPSGRGQKFIEALARKQVRAHA